jgi:hypothetical protein
MLSPPTRSVSCAADASGDEAAPRLVQPLLLLLVVVLLLMVVLLGLLLLVVLLPPPPPSPTSATAVGVTQAANKVSRKRPPHFGDGEEKVADDPSAPSQ